MPTLFFCERKKERKKKKEKKYAKKKRKRERRAIPDPKPTQTSLPCPRRYARKYDWRRTVVN